MAKGTSPILRMSVMFAIILLAIVASLYSLGVFENEAIKQVLFKLMTVIAIWTGASLLIMLISASTGRKNT